MRSLGASIFAIVFLYLAPAAVSQGAMTAEEAQALAALEAELPGTLMNNPMAPGWATHGATAATKVVKAPEVPGGLAYEVRVKQANRNPWDVSVTAALTSGVSSGDAVLIAFWARATKPAEETGGAEMQVRAQQTAAPYTGIAEAQVTVQPKWQLHYVKGIAPASYDTGKISLAFNTGKHKQTVQFGQVYVMNLGPGVRLDSLPSAPEDL